MKKKQLFVLIALGLGVISAVYFFLQQKPQHHEAPENIEVKNADEEELFVNALLKTNGMFHLKIRGNSPYLSEDGSITDSISIIPLMPGSQSSLKLVGNIRKVAFSGNKILILNSQFKLYAFDREGNFLQMVTPQGEGPGETLQITDFVIYRDEIYTLEAAKPYLQVFDLKTFSYRRNLPIHPEYTYTHFEHFANQWFFYCINSLGGSKTIHIYAQDFSKIKDMVLENQISVKSMIVAPENPFNKGSDFLRIEVALNDTIFQYRKNEGLTPFLVADFGKNKIDETAKRVFQEGSFEEASRLYSSFDFSKILNYAENDDFIWMSVLLSKSKNVNDIYINKEGNTWFQLSAIALPPVGQILNGAFVGMFGDFFVFSYTEEESADLIKTKLLADGAYKAADLEKVSEFLVLVKFR